jgi:hypothetical protein
LNGRSALEVVGPGTVILSGNIIGYTATSLAISNGANVVSYANNIFRGGGTPTQIVPLK